MALEEDAARQRGPQKVSHPKDQHKSAEVVGRTSQPNRGFASISVRALESRVLNEFLSRMYSNADTTDLQLAANSVQISGALETCMRSRGLVVTLLKLKGICLLSFSLKWKSFCFSNSTRQRTSPDDLVFRRDRAPDGGVGCQRVSTLAASLEAFEAQLILCVSVGLKRHPTAFQDLISCSASP